MKDINTLLNMIKVKPALYLGKFSITRLCMFIHGYTWAILDYTDSDDVGKPLGQLTWHLTHKYRIRESLDWCGILLSIKIGDEEEALSLFWDEWDDFVSKPCTCPQEHWDSSGKIVWRYCRDFAPIEQTSEYRDMKSTE